MFGKVIVGYDGSPQGRDAFVLGQLLAGIAESGLLVAFVRPAPRGPFAAARRRRSRRVAEQLFSQITPAPWASGLAVDARVLDGGHAATALAALAEREQAGLVVLGSTRLGTTGRVLLGSNAERLLHDGPAAVAVAPMAFADRPSIRFDERCLRTIAAAFDGRAESRAALSLAARLARRCGATLRVITAVHPTQSTPFGESPSAPRDPREELKAAVASLPADLERVAVCRRGEPSRVVLEQAEQEVDLLLMGSRGAGTVGRVYLGSVAGDVLHQAPCPVLITPRSTLEVTVQIGIEPGSRIGVPHGYAAGSSARGFSSNEKRRGMAAEKSVQQAKPGDRLVVRGHHQGEPQRDGEILEVLGEDGGPPFRVRWEDGHESEVFPGSDVFVQHFED